MPTITPSPCITTRPAGTLPTVMQVYDEFTELKKSETDQRTYEW